jgi:hypothetical protein
LTPRVQASSRTPRVRPHPHRHLPTNGRRAGRRLHVGVADRTRRPGVMFPIGRQAGRPLTGRPLPLAGRRLRRSVASPRSSGARLMTTRFVRRAGRVDLVRAEDRAIRFEVLRCLVRVCGAMSRWGRNAGTQRAELVVRLLVTWSGLIRRTRLAKRRRRGPHWRSSAATGRANRVRPTCGKRLLIGVLGSPASRHDRRTRRPVPRLTVTSR